MDLNDLDSSPAASLRPIAFTERVRELDVVRGFALFGVLLVNAIGFNQHNYAKYAMDGLFGASLEQGIVNRLLSMAISTFAVANFYTIFSFLFGVGFYVFYSRAKEKGRVAKKLFVRRCAILFAIGTLHFALVWQGDVLHTYALVGLLLPRFGEMELRRIGRWIVVLFVVSTVIISTIFYYMSSNNQGLDPVESSYGEKRVAVYSEESYLETVSFRLRNETGMTLGNSLLVLPKVLGLFLMGLYAGKSGLISNLRENVPRIRRIWRGAGVVGGLLAMAYAVIQYGPFVTSLSAQQGLAMFFKEASSIFISVFYTTSIVLLYQLASGKRVLAHLAPLGQMALTNYLLQCIICSVLFYGYGPRLSPSMTGIFMITVVIYLTQIYLSRLWLSKYKYGPFEAAWRYLTYAGSI